MTARVEERELAGLRWLVLTGARADVFHTLGQAARDDIHAVSAALPEREALRRWATTSRGQRRLERLLRATRATHAQQLGELRQLADGADADFQDLLLANLRGDLGTDDGTGCTDIGWRRETSYIAHNEDGAPALHGRLTLLTLRIEGDTPVTVAWYPGFLPANTVTATGNGLLWGINHVQVARPADAPGRHFVARALQQSATLDDAVHHLDTHPTAGGFSYTLGERGSGRVLVAESATGRTTLVEAAPEHPLRWHTNHLRHLPDPPDVPGGEPANAPVPESAGADGSRATRALGQYDESLARGRVLDDLALPSPGHEPTDAWFLTALTSAPLPHGVHRTATHDDALMTLCTVVANLTEDRVTVRGTAGDTATLPLSDFAQGDARNASAVAG